MKFNNYLSLAQLSQASPSPLPTQVKTVTQGNLHDRLLSSQPLRQTYRERQRMAPLLELPNELLTAIGSHLRKPSDILQFILVNQRAHSELRSLLYQNIHLDYRDANSPLSACHTDISPRCGYPFVPINLLNTLLSIRPQFGSNTRSLEIVIVDYTSCQQYGLVLLPHLPRLQHLRLSIRKVDDLFATPILSPSTLADSLNYVSGTLRTLRLHADHNPSQCDGSRIGSLRHYTLLESLTIQSHILLGEDMNSLSHLNAVLPPALQGLRVGFVVNGADSIENEGNVRVLAYSQKGDLINPLPATRQEEDPNALRERHRVTLILQRSNPSQLGPKTRNHTKKLTMEEGAL